MPALFLRNDGMAALPATRRGKASLASVILSLVHA